MPDVHIPGTIHYTAEEASTDASCASIYLQAIQSQFTAVESHLSAECSDLLQDDELKFQTDSHEFNMEWNDADKKVHITI